VADLATLAEYKAYLGDDPTSLPADAVLQNILDGTEAELEAALGRTHRPFAAALTAREETHDGTGTGVLFLDYPIATIASLALGHDIDAPVETLDPDDKAVVVWQAGSARVARVDCGRFGCARDPNYVHVTYDTQADLPADCKLALLEVAAGVYRKQGDEHLASERMGPYSVEFRSAVAASSAWSDALRNHAEVLV
jgi:hypothetical protein